METRRGYDHPRSQGEDEIFQESRRSLNHEITKLPEPRDTFQTCDIHCILFSSPSVFMFSVILTFWFLNFYISLFIPVLVLKPSTGINGCISEARSGKMSKFFGGQSDSESSSSEESSSEEEVSTTSPPPQITFHSPLLTALVPFHIYPWFDLTLKLSFDCITYYYYLSTGPSHCTNGLGIIYPCYFRKDF